MTGARPSVGSSITSSRGLTSRRAADGQHLLLAAGELGAAVAPALGQAREGLVDALDGPGPLGAVADQAQMLVHRERGPDAPPLRHIADAHIDDLIGRQAEDLVAGEADAAARGGHQPHDRVAERRLAHAVAADHRQHAAVEASATRPAAHGHGRSRHADRSISIAGAAVPARAGVVSHGGRRPDRCACTSGSSSISAGVPCLKMAAVVHHRDPVDDAQRDVEVMLDDDEADVRGSASQQRDQLAPLGRRQPGGRLVEQDQRGAPASAMPISSWRCWPCESSATSCSSAICEMHARSSEVMGAAQRRRVVRRAAAGS